MAETGEALRAVRPSAGFEKAYAEKLTRLVAEMSRSCIYWISAAYRADPPEMAQDESPARRMDRVMKGLSRRWLKRFDEASKELADWFARGAANRTDAQMSAILRDAGFSVKFSMTRTVNDVVRASIAENVQLIRNIPQQYLTQIQGAVMRSVSAGRDLQSLVKDLEGQHGITRRRAERIALDQNNKATAVIQDARRAEIGITEAEWLHSGGGKHPRHSHKDIMSGKTYDVARGMWDPEVKEFIRPGQLVGCRCVSRSIMPWRKAKAA